MAGTLTQPHLRRLDALHRVRHVLQGESGTITLLKRDATTGAINVPVVSVDRGWTYGDRDAEGRALPPHVRFELWVAEELITRAEVAQGMAWQHGAQVFQIARAGLGEPGIFQPSGFNRFWRFWITPLEEVA
jgi:hypothetical protein